MLRKVPRIKTGSQRSFLSTYLLSSLRFCPGLHYLSPLGYRSFRPEWGSNILAQGRVQRRNVAERRPGYCKAPNRRPERAKQNAFINDGWTVLPFQGDEPCFPGYPGRRFALPWALMLMPHSGRRTRVAEIFRANLTGHPRFAWTTRGVQHHRPWSAYCLPCNSLLC